MKILELEVWNVRGIQHISLQPKGKNLVIWGRNGSGKSAVIDAVDFLLTGRISRLMGEGTGDLSLAKHGPHILHKPDEAIVRAKVEIPCVDGPIEIRRCMKNPSELEIACRKEYRNLVEFTLDFAKRGNHLLTRRELLKYIYTEPKKRAERIEALLNISEIGEIRSALMTTKNKAKDEYLASKIIFETAEGAINATTGKAVLITEDVLGFINTNRGFLDGKPIDKIIANQIQTGLRKPVDISPIDGVNTALTDKDIETLLKVLLRNNQDEVFEKDNKLRQVIEEIRKDPSASFEVSRLRLFEMGKDLIEENGNCPLCDTSWEPEKLIKHLNNKIEKIHGYNDKNKLMNELSSDLVKRISIINSSLQSLITTLEKVGEYKNKPVLESWQARIKELLSSLNAPLEKYPVQELDSEAVKVICAPAKIEDILYKVKKALHEKIPEATPELDAWTSLDRITENIKALESSKVEYEKATLFKKRAEILYDNFIVARDKILDALYDSIRLRFVDLYKALHSSDEKEFQAKLSPAGAGLDFEVDFYGHGTHPPHALHSEGHQDSMGLCLYFALVEELNLNIINVIILDDVVMSIDAEHRKQVSRLLATSFPNKQFMITTHDRYWANQLKSAGVVRSKQLIEFQNWCIESGPQTSYDTVVWEEIEECLEQNEIPAAAYKLRRGLESYFQEVCGSLKARIEYNADQRWDLGDFLPAAISKYLELLQKAKDSANSWNKRDLVIQLVDKVNLSRKIINETRAEEWAVNASVHCNTWGENCTKEDFAPIVKAFKDVCSLFECKHCGTLLELSLVDNKLASLSCRCGEEVFNLKIKSK